MNTSIRELLAIAAVAGGAAFVSVNATDGKELIMSAPIQQIDRGAETVNVLGQSFHAQVAQLNIGEVVKVYGSLQKDGSVKDADVEGTGAYGANGDTVFLKGIVTASDPALGHVEVDGMTIDYTSQLANGSFAIPSVGDTIEFSGSEPVEKGVLMASASGAGAYPVAPVASAASVPAEMVGGGVASAEMVGGGLAKSEMVGGGVASSEMVGGGLNSSEMVGGGLAKSEMVGGGVATSEMVGGGLNSSEMVGGGLAKSEMVGGGVASSEMVGGGLNSSEMVGGGLAKSEMVGGGVATSEMVGGGVVSAAASVGRR